MILFKKYRKTLSRLKNWIEISVMGSWAAAELPMVGPKGLVLAPLGAYQRNFVCFSEARWETVAINCYIKKDCLESIPVAKAI